MNSVMPVLLAGFVHIYDATLVTRCETGRIVVGKVTEKTVSQKCGF